MTPSPLSEMTKALNGVTPNRIWVYRNARGSAVWTSMKPAIAGAHEEEEFVHASLFRTLEGAVERLRAAIEEMEERYENWTSIDTPPSEHSSPRALLEFRCFSDAEEDSENPEYSITRVWGDRPDDAVEWCPINSPNFIARTALTKGGSNGG